MSRTLKSEPYAIESINVPLSQPLDWRINKIKSALLIHDMQNYFVHALPNELSHATTHSIKKILNWARHNDLPIFYSAQPGRMTPDQRGLLADLWGPGMRTTEEDRRIIEELAPGPDDMVLTKWRYSAFYQSILAEILRERQCDSLIITGIYASVGISATAVEAFTRDIKPFLVADAVADFTRAGHQQAVDYLAKNCARVLTTEEVTEYD